VSPLPRGRFFWSLRQLDSLRRTTVNSQRRKVRGWGRSRPPTAPATALITSWTGPASAFLQTLLARIAVDQRRVEIDELRPRAPSCDRASGRAGSHGYSGSRPLLLAATRLALPIPGHDRNLTRRRTFFALRRNVREACGASRQPRVNAIEVTYCIEMRRQVSPTRQRGFEGKSSLARRANIRASAFCSCAGLETRSTRSRSRRTPPQLRGFRCANQLVAPDLCGVVAATGREPRPQRRCVVAAATNLPPRFSPPPADAANRPSGEKPTVNTKPLWLPSTRRSFPVGKSHSRTCRQSCP